MNLSANTHIEERDPGIATAGAFFVALLLSGTSSNLAADDSGIAFFKERIEPVLQSECYKCHSTQAEKVKGGLLLDSRDTMRKGGDTGPAIVPGKVEGSLLINAIRHERDLEMPPKKPKLADRVISDFVKWVEMGAPDPREGGPSAPGDQVSPAARQHWAFQPVRKPDPPKVRQSEWIRNPVDAFILSTLEDHKARPSTAASRFELIRRAYFDLTGLPPSPEEVEKFVNDPSPEAYPRLVDRLLDSPRYGERWAQHWLDVVRFAESEGFEYDRHVPDAWRFRDYVIESLNRDKPFNQFVMEQLAGDEIEPGNHEFQTATIFHRLGAVRRNAGNPDIALSRNEVLTERTDIIGSAFLGLTVGCARCHNHKLEPIPQKDYYRLQAYLAATEEHNINLASPEEEVAWNARSKDLKVQIEQLRKQVKKATGAEKDRLEQELEELEDKMPAPLPTIPATWNDSEHRTAIHVLKRGVWEAKGEEVGSRPLSVLAPEPTPESAPDAPNPRTRLARWLTDSSHPLTARVLVNRLWLFHFGAGLVATANDFGTHGQLPSHPALLDWLAATLVENGWRLKPLHRLILLSSTYQQSSQQTVAEAISSTDPDNRLLWHFSRRRLSAEEIRDAMLSVSGRLNLKAGGQSVMVPVDPELVHQLYKPSQWQPPTRTTEHDRRSVYLIAKRNLRLPFMETFDAPALQTSCARRESSTHAPQALEMLNGMLSNSLAESFAHRVESESGGSRDRMVERAYRLAIGRPPTPAERRVSLQYLDGGSTREFALAMFNLNAFLYVQ